MWTLAYNSTEQSFPTWGFTDPTMRLVSQGRSIFSVRMPGASGLTGAPPIPFEGQVAVWRGRAGNNTGGSKVFQGRMVTNRLSANPRRPGRVLTFADAWYDLQNLVYQQQWSYKVSGQTVTSALFAKLNLFQNYQDRTVGGTHYLPGVLIPSGVQIADIINYAAACGVNIQAGTIDTMFALPVYPVKAMMCAEAIMLCLRGTPDAVTWIDYSTTPPTFNCRQRSNLATVTLPYADGTRHESSEITPRPDLQVPAVVLQYMKTNSENGSVYTLFDTKAYPLNSTGQTPRALVCPIDLRGGSTTNFKVTVQSTALNLSDLNWWKKEKPELAKANITGLALVGTPTVKDESGATVSLSTWPNVLGASGEVLPWMKDAQGHQILAKQVKIEAKFTYTESDPKGRNNLKVHSDGQPVTVRVKLTNSAAGSVSYSPLESFDAGETEPVGLEQQIYDSLQPLQFEGDHVIFDGPGASETMSIVSVGSALNISGGAAEWATMASTIQQVEVDFFAGRTSVAFGPAKHLAPGELHELLQMWRFRAVYDNPSLRVSAQVAGGSADLGGDTATENTTQGNPPLSLHVVSANL